MKNKRLITLLSIVAITAAVLWAQRQPGLPPSVNRRGVPNWELDNEMPRDVFTFVRIRYSSSYGRRGGGWRTDYPDADLNFSYRLQELTSLKVHPEGIILELTDPKLFDYPFIYIIEPGALQFSNEEVVALRKYLLNGGFLMVDDFWGGDEYENFAREMKRVFPDRAPKELPLEHPIFHCVFDLKEKPQLPSIGQAMNGQDFEWRPGADDGSEVHYQGFFDDKDRMMAIICHNTDLGDGWEREGENQYYFKTYSEPKAYPMGINIVFYALTH